MTLSNCLPEPIFRHLITLLFVTVALPQANAADTGEWEFGCNEQQRCHTFINGQGIRIAFANDANSTELKGAVVVPTASSPNQPVTLRLDTGVEMRLAVSLCNQDFCEARIDSSKSLLVIEQITKAKKVTVAYLDQGIIQVSTLSLLGFRSSYRKLEDLLNYRINEQIKGVLDRWSAAWSNGDLESYLSFYDTSFKSGKFATKSEWEENRRQSISPERVIEVLISDVQIALKDHKTVVEATFNQKYTAKEYKDNTEKQLLLNRVGNDWKITSEIDGTLWKLNR